MSLPTDLNAQPDWTPFLIGTSGHRPPPPRPIETPEGVGDRLRAAAFAEIQAREAFLWAASHFLDCPKPVQTAWRGLALAEDRHLKWLLRRMVELNISVQERAVSTQLWESFQGCTSAQEFAWFMASAEERGRRAGERFQEALRTQDPESSRIFGQIALEEIEHIRLAQEYFGFDPRGREGLYGKKPAPTDLSAGTPKPTRPTSG